jgi:hypothetical protein
MRMNFWTAAETLQVYREEQQERQVLARSSRGRYTGAGAVTVRLPSDALEGRELAGLNGPARSYDLGRPLGGAEFEALPDDLKRLYLRLLRDRHGGTERQIRRLTGARESYGVCLSAARGDRAKWRRFLRGEGR